ncbi:hypothetical protein [Sphingomonas sp. PP-CC-3A-396]|uniref:hypothetical protein n=1 Tax=Sphingomonas sp. PP-CC-3A-396 TaxID=2135655 RepID=UPI0010479786|nr:hypothetical protein [Sphingomonas sp. PP-CC-3A-396]TCQ04035.1 hypothetical protein C8J40_109169 [Sphingomonas sp. PP-CC-3A-396]
MAIRWTITVAIQMLAFAQPPAAPSQSSDAQRLAAMTPSQFLARTTLHDDDLDTFATITTVNGFVARRPLLGIVSDDVFLRAFIDKRSGRTAYQVYATVRYRDYGWADWQAANYATPTGPRSIATQRIARVRASCARGLACARSETVGFTIGEALLKINAALYATDQSTAWRFKIMARSGAERPLLLTAAEISGLLMAVDAYRTDRHLPKS